MGIVRRIYPVVFAAILAGAPTLAIAEICPLPAETLNYTIFNDEDDVGGLELAINRAGDQATVKVSMKILVRILMVPAYRFKHSSTEVWAGDRLASLTAQTSDNGDDFAISMKQTGDSHEIQSADGLARQTGTRLTELLWCEGAAKSGAIISTLTGNVSDIPIDFIGKEDIQQNGRTIATRHYRFTRKKRVGDFWYDKAGKLVKLSYPTRYFSVAHFVLQPRGR
jgi:hypothetical protein